MAKSVFVTAEWKNLIMANYPVSPDSLTPWLPRGTELDRWEGKTYVSLVGFLFQKVRVRGLSIPFHTFFPEVNLRFYVRFKSEGQWKRGVVFISEIVPKRMVSLVANGLFNERYRCLPMRQTAEIPNKRLSDQRLAVGYQWKFRDRWNELSVNAGLPARELEEGSREEFITEHFWGYSAIDPARTGEYQVAHPRWNIYPVLEHTIRCDFAGLYGTGFSELAGREPESVFLAEGSAVSIFGREIFSLSTGTQA